MKIANPISLAGLLVLLIGGSAVAADAAAIPPAWAGAEAAVFYLFASIAAVSAVAIVLSSNVIRAATWLLGTLMAVAALYFLLAASFLGAIQLIVYAGGTLVLIVFGVMLTTRSPWVKFTPRPWEVVFGGLVCAGLFVLLSAVLLRIDWAASARPSPEPATVAGLGRELLTTYLVPFEVASVLLLAVMIGAAYLARPEKRKP